VNNKERALKAIQENPGQFTAHELADHLDIKYALTMKLIHLEYEGKAHVEYIEVEKGPFKLKEKVPKWFPEPIDRLKESA